MDDKTPRKKSPVRRLLRAAVVLVVLAGSAAAALPWALRTTLARRAIVAAVNRAVAPSKVGVGGISVSWTGSIRLSGVTLRDKDGKTLLTAKQAVLDRGLLALALDRSRLGTLTLDGAAIDAERRADGSIDLVDALTHPAPVPAPSPDDADAPAPAPAAAAGPAGRATAVTLRVVRSTIRVRTPELAEPVEAGQADIEVVVPSTPGRKLTWRIRLAEPAGGLASETIGIDGEYDHRAAATPDMNVTIKGERWPLAVEASGVLARGRLDGVLKLGRAAGKWSSTGEAKLLSVDASGPALAGDRLKLDAVGGTWDLAGSAAGWAVHKLDVVSPVATLSATGSVAPGGGLAWAQPRAVPDARVEGKIDLAALARQAPHTLRLRDGMALEKGSVRVALVVKTDGDFQRGALELNVSELVAREKEPARKFTLDAPAAITVKADRKGEKVNLETLAVKSAFLELTASGDLDQGVKLAGKVDLALIETQFHDLIDFGGVQLAGQGRMAGDYRRKPKGKDGDTFVGRYAAEFKGLKVAGLTAEPVVRDTIRFDAASSGPAGPGGLPGSWQNVRVNLKSLQDTIAVAAVTAADVTSLKVYGSVPVTVSNRAGQADVKFSGRWKPPAGKNPKPGAGVVEFDELRLGLRPLDPALAAAGTLAFAARGWLDLDDDGLSLTPLPCPSPLVLGTEGMSLHGLRKTPVSERAWRGCVVGDVAAIEQALYVWKGREPTGLGGALAASFAVGPAERGKLNVGMNLSVPDLSRAAPDGKGRKPEGPLVLGCASVYDPAADRLNIGTLVALTRYARLDGKGTLDEPAGRRLADLSGVIAPNWVAVSTLVAGMTEPKAVLVGTDRAFRLKGALSGDSTAAVLKGLDAEVGVELTSADVMGLTLGPAPLVVRCQGGAFTVDPIRTTLNNGVVDLKPGLAVDETKGISVLLARGSKVEGAEINDEVSRDLFTYIAPVLDKATHVHGKFSATVDRGDFPITGPPDHRVSMTGQLVFQDVVFAPGPFADQVLGLVGKPNQPGLRLHQPVQLTVADGRVFQKGLSLPINKDASIAMEGSVGFDESLDLRATVPITKGMLGASAGLDDLVGDGKVVVPIDGTVSHPRVNRQALQVAIRALAKNVIKRDLSKEASKLLDRLGPAIDANGAGAGAGPNADGIPGDLRGLENQLLKRLAPGGTRRR